MVDTHSALAVIPAWAGASLLIQPLATHPLIEYTFAACAQARSITRTVVLSLDDQIIQAAGTWGIQSLPLSVTSPDLPMASFRQVQELVRVIVSNDATPPGVIVWVDPFYPLRQGGDLDRATTQASTLPAGSLVQSMIPLNSTSGVLWTSPDEETWWPLSGYHYLYAQTGHFLAARLETCLSGSLVDAVRPFPFTLEPGLEVDVRQEKGWDWAEWLLQRGQPGLVYPGRPSRPLPEQPELLILDFDGVLTDNRVWVDEEGHEQVAAYRSDSLGLSYLRAAGIEAMVISMETNPVVSARCRKMKLPVLQGIDDKATTLSHLLQERRIDPGKVVYLGNDLNDVPCFPLVGCAVVVADAQPGAKRQADLVLTQPGGHGAVRELCDRLIALKKG